MIALHCVSSGEFSPTLLMGAVDSAVLCCYPVYFVVSASSGLFYIEVLWYPIMSEPQLLFYIGTENVIIAAHNL